MAGKENLFGVIPGYEASVRKEQLVRAVSFLDAPENICGVSVKPLTLSHVALLEAAQSPYIVGGPVTAEDTLLFLWVVSTQFVAGDIGARDAFYMSWLHLSIDGTRDAIQDYVEEAFQDAPGGKQGGDSPYGWAASFVDAIASEYGWLEREILCLPLKRVFQYCRCIRRRHDPKAVFIDSSDKVRQVWIDEQRKKQ